MREILEEHVKMTITEAARRMKISRPALYAVLNRRSDRRDGAAVCLPNGRDARNFISTCKPVTISNWQSSAFKTNSPTSRQGGRNNFDFAEQHRSKLHGTIRLSGTTMK
jgi:hypothetical protein